MAKVWALRVLVIAGITCLGLLADSGQPALAFALAWGPNGLFLLAFTRGALHLPRLFEPVHPREPVVYRWLGVSVVKWVVTRRVWPALIGFEPLPKPRNRHELLARTELATKGAEVCHGATLVLGLAVALFCLAVGQVSAAAWIVVFNVVLNGYPVMLQRSNRWRIQQRRASVVATPMRAPSLGVPSTCRNGRESGEPNR